MEVEERVQTFIDSKTFSSQSAKEKTRAALVKHYTEIDAILATDTDDDGYEDFDNEDQYSDGVESKTSDEFNEEQTAKKLALRNKARELFSTFSEPDASVATEDINQRLKWGYTLLHFAALAGDETECDRLIAAGASKAVADNGGKLPWQKAELKGFVELAEKLKP